MNHALERQHLDIRGCFAQMKGCMLLVLFSYLKSGHQTEQLRWSTHTCSSQAKWQAI